MDDPVAEVTDVILKLTRGSPRTQQAALEQYFIPKASFFHPFCSVHHNRDAVLRIFQWYKIMSPHIDITVNSIAYDSTNLTLYVNISQIFRIFIIPFYRAPVTLTTVLQLERGSNLNLPPALQKSPLTTTNTTTTTGGKYYIRSQNDLYQIDQFIRFALPWGIGTTLILFWHWFATLCCIIGARVGAPLRWSHQALVDARPAVYPDIPVGMVDGVDGVDGEGMNGSVRGHLEEWADSLHSVAASEKTLIDVQGVQVQQRGQF